MRVLIYYEQQGYGGVDTHLAHLVNNWPIKKDKLFIISNPNNKGLDYFRSLLSNPNVIIHTIKGVFNEPAVSSSKFMRLFILLRNNFRFPGIFHDLLKELNPDIMLSNNGGYPGGLTNWTAAIVGKKYFKFSNSVSLLIHHAPVKKTRGLYSKIVTMLTKKVLSYGIPIITVSQASKKMLEKFTPLSNLRVIYNGISYSNLNFQKYNFNDKYKIPSNRLLIGMIGPIDPHKGHASIIEVFKKSEILRNKAHFIIVGAGEKEFINEISESVSQYGLTGLVTFTGFLPDDSMSLISAFDILVMPTIDFEGFGYSMAEAMLSGVPVIASRVGAIPEVIIHRESGFLVDKSEIEIGFKDILEKLVQNKKLRAMIGEAGRKRVKENFSAQSMSQEYYDFN